MKCYNRKEIIEKIVQHLFEEELLNEKDANSIDDLKKSVEKVIEYELEDYKIIAGDIL